MSGKELFIRFTARAFRKLLSFYVFNYFPFRFEGRIWDLIVSVPDHCLSFYFTKFWDNCRLMKTVFRRNILIRTYDLLVLFDISIRYY